jgi:Tfp pilus assembly protein PilF
MSLLADILTRVKQPRVSRDIPPNLKKIVQSASGRGTDRKKYLILGCVFIIGLAIIKMGKIYLANEESSIAPAGMVNTAPAQRDITPAVHPTASEQTGNGANKAVPDDDPRERAAEKANPVTSKATPAPKQTTADNKATEEEATSPAGDNIARKSRDSSVYADKVDPRKKATLLYRAREYESKGNYTRALATYRKYLHYDPENVSVLNNMAYLYLQLGMPDQSAEYARRAIGVQNDYVPALINLGIALAGNGKTEDAARALEKAVNIEPENEEAVLNLAILHERMEDYDSALRYYERAMGLGSIQAMIGEARVMEKTGETSKALSLYKELSRKDLDPDTAARVRHRLWILQNRG